MPLWSKVIKQVSVTLDEVTVRPRNVLQPPGLEGLEKRVLIQNAYAEAERILQQGHAEAERVIQEAQKKAARIEKDAYKKGWNQGQKEAWQAVNQEAERIYASARQVLQQAEDIRQRIYQETEEEIVELVIETAEKLVCRQLDLEPETVVNIAQAACQQMRDCSQLVIYVEPNQLDALKAQRQKIIAELDSSVRIQVIADPNLQPGDCRVESDQGCIDATLQTRLQQLGLMIKENGNNGSNR